MNLYSTNMQVGFLIGIYFLASAIAGLTLVYFSRPKPKNSDIKKKSETPVQSKTGQEQNQQLSPDHQSPPQKSEVGDNPMMPKPTVIKLPEPTPVADKPMEIKAKKEESDMIKLNAPRVGSPVNPPLITVTNAPKPQAQTVTPVNSAPGNPVLSPMSNTEKKEEKLPTNQPATENSAKKDDDDKTKSAGSMDEFSDLFTEDIEETEAMRLAKEMNDVDTEDLLQTSQDLISQFKRKS
jgi:hypothetical protein